MTDRASETIVQFSSGGDRLDAAAQSLLGLLERAASFAEENTHHALGVAQKLSNQLQAA